MKRISPLTYEINLPGATENVIVHINRLKKSPPPADSCDTSHEPAKKRRGRPRKLAGHPKKAKVVKELQRPMTVIPIEVDVPPPQPRRKRGRPKKTPIVTTELVEAPERRETMENQSIPPNEYSWRPENVPLAMPGFQQGIATVPPSLYDQFSHLRPPQQEYYIQQWPPQPLLFTNDLDFQNFHATHPPPPLQVPIETRYNLRQVTKQVQRY